MSEVEVVVTDRVTGEPVAGAHVGVFLVREDEDDRPGGRATLLQGSSGESGRCVLRADVTDGARFTVKTVVRARGHEEWRAPQFGGFRRKEPRPEELILAPGATLRIEVAMERGTTIRGRVTDASAGPVAGAHIGLVLSLPHGCSWPYAFSVGGSVHWPPPCTTDEHGVFEWLSFPVGAGRDGHFVLTAEHDDLVPAMIQSVELLPQDDSGVIDVEFTLATGVAFDGVVTGPGGTPAAGAVVRLFARQDADQPVCVIFSKAASTAADGRFALRGLKRTVHRMDVEMAGCAPFSRDIDLTAGPAGSCAVSLTGGTDLEGQVLDRAGAPVPDGRVIAMIRETRLMRQAQTDATGRFRITGLPVQGRLEIRCPPYAGTEVDLPSGPVTLRAPATIELRAMLVADETGEPLGAPERSSVSVFGPGFSTHLQRDGAGGFRAPKMPAGHYRLVADVPERGIAELEADVTEDGLAAPLVLRVPRGGAARGKVIDVEGRALADVAVTAFGTHALHERRAASDAAGSYEVRGLSEWAYLVFSAEGFALLAKPVRPTGSSSEPVELDVVLGPGATVTGRVVRRDGTPVARASVKIVPADRPRVPWELPSALTTDDGRFVLSHVPEGTFAAVTGTARASIDAVHGATFDVELAVD